MCDYSVKSEKSCYLIKDGIILNFKKGQSLRSISNDLKKHNLIKSSFLFEIFLRIKGDGNKLQAGEYQFHKNIKTDEIIEKMVSGEVLLHPILIIEGLTSKQIMKELNTYEELEGDIPEFISEGSLLPETYFVPRGQKKVKLIAKMRQNHQILIDKLWEERSDKLPYKSKKDAIIIASLIERETSKSSEKSRVAAVFINRLRKNMRLQSDPTVIYGIYKEKDILIKNLSKEDLIYPTEFNTYLINGLPPTPICHPGKESLIAAFNPLKTKDLYFVADGTGGHIFSKTYKEHQINHQNWRKIRDFKEKNIEK